MENLETGKDKIKKLCEILKNETLKPAQEEAQQILEIAQQEAHQIIRDAERKASDVRSLASAEIQKEKELFETSLKQACKQGVAALRQEIENKLFNESLTSWVESQTKDPDVAKKLITSLVSAIEKEGISADFSAIIPKEVPKEKVNTLLAKEILDKLKEHSVTAGSFIGGVQIKLHDRKMTLDLSDEAIKELLGLYIRKDFRRLLFQEG